MSPPLDIITNIPRLRDDHMAICIGIMARRVTAAAKMKNIQISRFPDPKLAIFIPKKDVEKFRGMKTNASFVSRPTLIAASFDSIDSFNCVLTRVSASARRQ